MKTEKLNRQALNCLGKQKVKEAQMRFFENVRKNPCCQTYHNLGWFLISEGFVCRNGKIKKAHKLGRNYLFRAMKIRKNPVTLLAIAKTYEYERTISPHENKKQLAEQARLCKDALLFQYSPIIHYNYLRSLYYIDPKEISLLDQGIILLRNYICNETVTLFLALLYHNSLLEKGLIFIEKYISYIDEIDLLMFYAKFEIYDKAYPLCKSICEQYSIDKYIASAIIESCVKTNHFNQAAEFARKIWEIEESFQYEKESWTGKVFRNLHSSDVYRKKKIDEYSFSLPFLDTCCYFGCNIHGTKWQ